jgi:hypothetical protein
VEQNVEENHGMVSEQIFLNNNALVSDGKQACPPPDHPAEDSSHSSKLEEPTQDLIPFKKARVSIRARSEAPLVLYIN